jgi:hypothetical protein
MKYILEHRSWLDQSDLTSFLDFCKAKLGYSAEPRIDLSDDLQHAKEVGSMGHFDPGTGIIWVFKGRRVKADWYRTLAHELVHHAQRERGDTLDGSTGSDTENEANSKAGEILRAWGKMDPAIFESSFGESFDKKLRLWKLGLIDLENISSRIWFPRKTWTKPDFRTTWDRLPVNDLLTDEDFKYLDSLREEGVVWYTDPTPGVKMEEDDEGFMLKIVGPSSAVKRASDLIDIAFNEAFLRISDDPGRDGLKPGGWNELIWNMEEPELNQNFAGGQKETYQRWLKDITRPDEARQV